jgi:hypothetical protein
LYVDDETSDEMIKRITSSVSITKKNNKNKFNIFTTSFYSDRESDLYCFYLESTDSLLSSIKKISLFKIKYNKNKSFKIVKVLSKKSFYEIIDNIFQDN